MSKDTEAWLLLWREDASKFTLPSIYVRPEKGNSAVPLAVIIDYNLASFTQILHLLPYLQKMLVPEVPMKIQSF